MFMTNYNVTAKIKNNLLAREIKRQLLTSKGLTPDEIANLKKLDDKTLKLVDIAQYNKGEATVKEITKVLFVATFKNDASVYTQAYSPNQLSLSVKQAGLLAAQILGRINKIGGKYATILSPLAGAIFSKEDLEEMSQVVKDGDTTIPLGVFTSIVNISCQSGGHNIDESMAPIVIAASFAATRNLKKDDGVKTSIRTKTLKQYLRRDKKIDKELTLFFMSYGYGGLPAHLSEPEFDKLYKMSFDVTNKDIPTEETGADGTVKTLSMSERADLRKNLLKTRATK